MPSLFVICAWNAVAATVLAAFVWLGCRTRFCRNRPHLIHALWILALAKLVTPAVIPLPLLPAIEDSTWRHGSEIELPVAPSIAIQFVPNPTRLQELLQTTEEPIRTNVETPDDDWVAGIDERFSPKVGAAPMMDPTRVPRREKIASKKTMASLATVTEMWPALLIGVSCLGTSILLCAAFGRSRQVRLLLRHTQPGDERMRVLARRAAEQMGVRGEIRIRAAPTELVPFVWVGWQAPTIVLPIALREQMNDDQLTSILCHELGHCARGDHWCNLFGFAVVALCWWHPAAWWARREMRDAQEICCDLLVLRRGASTRRKYAETLLEALEFIQTGRPVPLLSASAFGSKSSILRRFETLARTDVRDQLSRSFKGILAACAIALLCFPVAGNASSEPQTPPTMVPETKAPEPIIPLAEKPDVNLQIAKRFVEAKRGVLVVCAAPTEIKWDYGSIDRTIARHVAEDLSRQGVSVMDPEKVERWVAEHDYSTDPAGLARDFDVNYLVRIELLDYSLYEKGNSVSYRGSCNLKFSVYAVSNEFDDTEAEDVSSIHDSAVASRFPSEGPVSSRGLSYYAFKHSYDPHVSAAIVRKLGLSAKSAPAAEFPPQWEVPKPPADGKPTRPTSLHRQRAHWPETVVATVNGRPLFAEQLLSKYAAQLEEVQTRVSAEEFRLLQENLVKKELPSAVDIQLRIAGLKSALKPEHLRQLDEYLEKDIDIKLAEMMKQQEVATIDELKTKFKPMGFQLSAWKQDYRDSLMAQQYSAMKAQSKYEPTDGEIQDYYQGHRTEFEIPGHFRWQQIKITGDIQQEVEILLNRVEEALREGSDFWEVAKQYSTVPQLSSERSRECSDVASLKEEGLRRALLQTPIGAPSAAIRTADGFRIVKVLERRIAELKPLDDVRDEIRTKLKQENGMGLLHDALSDLRQNAEIVTIFDFDW